MKRSILVALAIAASIMTLGVYGYADRGGHGSHGGGGSHSGHVGIGVMVGPWWGPYYPPYPYYPYYPYFVPPPAVVPAQPDVYVQPAPQTEGSDYWYYCPNPEGYYPYVKRCPNGWLRVVPYPPATGEE